jgi:hypothetical protein
MLDKAEILLKVALITINIESNTGKSARQGNLRHPRGFPCLALFAGV